MPKFDRRLIHAFNPQLGRPVCRPNYMGGFKVCVDPNHATCTDCLTLTEMMRVRPVDMETPMGGEREERRMQPPDNEREVLVQLEDGAVTAGNYFANGNIWRVHGEVVNVSMWRDMPKTLELQEIITPYCFSYDNGRRITQART